MTGPTISPPEPGPRRSCTQRGSAWVLAAALVLSIPQNPANLTMPRFAGALVALPQLPVRGVAVLDLIRRDFAPRTRCHSTVPLMSALRLVPGGSFAADPVERRRMHGRTLPQR